MNQTPPLPPWFKYLGILDSLAFDIRIGTLNIKLFFWGSKCTVFRLWPYYGKVKLYKVGCLEIFGTLCTICGFSSSKKCGWFYTSLHHHNHIICIDSLVAQFSNEMLCQSWSRSPFSTCFDTLFSIPGFYPKIAEHYFLQSHFFFFFLLCISHKFPSPKDS